MLSIQIRHITKNIWHRRKRSLLWCISTAGAMLVTWLLSQIGVAGQIASGLVALGFDTERVLFIEQIILTLLGSLLAGFFFLRRSPALVGSLFTFVLSYLFPFVLQMQHPAIGPGGQIQVLNAGALSSVLCTIVAVGILSAGTGAVIGKACGEVLLVPLVRVAQHFIARLKRLHSHPAPPVGNAPVLLLFSALVIASLVQTSTGINSILTYGPTTGLYWQAPVTGTLQSGTFVSPSLGKGQRSYWIYLPPSYFQTARRYPTLYLLHGSPGGPADWFTAAHAATTAESLVAAGKMRETILIGADGNGPVYRFSEWANSFDGRQRMEDAIAFDLVHFIDSHYRTLANAANRAIGGLSMGGYGAVNIAFHHPDIFHQVMSFSGYFHAEGPVFGTGAGSATYRLLNSPSLFLQTPLGVKNASVLSFIIEVGTMDGYYYHEGISLSIQLHKMGLRVRLLTSAGGHSWSVWARQFAIALPILEPPTKTGFA